MRDRYTYRVSWSEDDGEYVGTCAEFPSLSHLDPDRIEALRGIQALVEGVVRFVLVASSGSARTVVYQAIRCSAFDYRIEARYQTADDGTGAWSRAPEASPWLPMADTPMGRTARLIARSGVCEGRVPGGRADDRSRC